MTTVARTAASYGADVRTRARVTSATGTGVELRDELTGEVRSVRARAVVNATGVWAGDLDDQVRLRPSRGTHLVLRGTALPETRVAVMVPIPGSRARFAMVLPQPDGTIYVGLTDEPVDRPGPRRAARRARRRSTSCSTWSRPRSPPRRPATTWSVRSPGCGRCSRSPAPTRRPTSPAATPSSPRATGVTTVVGGKLTTYRRMAEDALDAVVAATGLPAGPCRTATLPLLGAATAEELRRSTAPARLVRRFGTDADLVLATAREVTGLTDGELLAPASETVPVTLAELVFAITHEGAHDVDDLLDRRTRVGLVAADREVAEPLARRALELARTPLAGHPPGQ